MLSSLGQKRQEMEKAFSNLYQDVEAVFVDDVRSKVEDYIAELMQVRNQSSYRLGGKAV